MFPASLDCPVKLVKKVLLDHLDRRVNRDKSVHLDYPDFPVNEGLPDYRECPVLKVKLDPPVQLDQPETRVSKEKLVKKDQLDLKDVLDRKVLLVHLVPRVTRVMLVLLDLLVEMVFLGSVVCLVFPDRWEHLVKTVIKENLVNQVKKATKDPKENLVHLVLLETPASAVK